MWCARGADACYTDDALERCSAISPRSRAFTGWLYAKMTQIFGDIGMDCADEFYATVNRVGQGYIRTEADEVHYNLHVLLRCDLERQLIAGTLAVQDLEAAWNARFLKDFGMVVDKPANGVLQDVHWAVGLFGYFPTYSLGNLYAGGWGKSSGCPAPQKRLAGGWLMEAR